MRRYSLALARWGATFAAAALAAACSKAGDVDDDSDVDTTGHVFDLAGSCAPDELVGEFDVESADIGTAQYATVKGSIANGVNWNNIGAFVGADGDCEVYELSLWSCDPACTGGQICNDESVCVEYPANQDLGTVKVTGLTEDVSIEPLEPSFTYQSASLDNPPFVPGQEILLTAEGVAGGEPVLLDGVGVTPLEVPSPGIVLYDTDDMVVTWTPSEDAESEIHGRFMIDQHGASKRWIYCTWEDTGTGVVPQSLAALLCDDWTGLPSFAQAYLYRRTVDSVDTPDGCAELRVQSWKTLNLTFDCPQP